VWENAVCPNPDAYVCRHVCLFLCLSVYIMPVSACITDVSPCGCLAAKFDSCNSLLSSFHTLLVNILQCVRLYIRNENKIKAKNNINIYIYTDIDITPTYIFQQVAMWHRLLIQTRVPLRQTNLQPEYIVGVHGWTTKLCQTGPSCLCGTCAAYWSLRKLIGFKFKRLQYWVYWANCFD